MALYLPLFPLNIVVFPGEKLNLHIFEPRYKQLISECHAQNATFGIPAFVNNAVGRFGTEIKILSVEKSYEGGEMDIKTKGVRSFKIVEFFRTMPDKLYAGGIIEPVEDLQNEDPVLKARIVAALKQLYQVLGLSSLFMELAPDFKAYDIAHHLGFTTEKEYELLQCSSEQERQMLIVEHLEQVLPVILQTEKIKEKVKMNGHFKHLTPPNF
jgi:ATP-dependent Lon protease